MHNALMSQAAPRRQRKYGWRHMLRERSWTGVSVIVAVTTIINVSSLGALLTPHIADATNTPSTSCTAYFSPSTEAAYGGPSSDVENPTNAFSQNNADAKFDSDDHHQFGGFGISLPTGAIATGVEVVVRGHRTNGSGAKDMKVYLSENGGASWPGSVKTISYSSSSYDSDAVGGTTDMWNRVSWTATELADGHFAVRLSNDYSSGVVGIDQLKVKVCYHIQTATLQVNKKVDTDGNGSFDGGNTTAHSLGFRWGYDASAVNRKMGHDEVSLVVGDHTVTENTISGFHLVGWYIGNGSCSKPEGTELPVTVNLTSEHDHDEVTSQDDEHGTTVTFCNAKDQANGSVTVTKKLDADGDGTFETLNPQGWTWQLDAATGLAMGGTEPTTPGDHTVLEHGPSDGFHFVGWFPTNQDYSCEQLPENPLYQTYPITVQLADGQNVAITLCNQKDAPKTGTIIVHKEVDVDGNGDFGDKVDGTDERGNSLGFRWGVAENNSTELFGDSLVVPAGNVSVWEKPVDGYALVGWHYSNNDLTCTAQPTRDTKANQTVLGETAPNVTVAVDEGQTVEITLCNQRETGTIDGYKWHDRNGDGIWQKDEEPLANVYFQTLHGQNDITDNNGYFRIENVPTGTEHLIEFAWNGSAWVSPDALGWVMTYPDQYIGHGAMNLQVTAGGTVHQNIGNFHRTSISGNKFSDENHNGLWDEGEPGLGNWTIQLWKFDLYYFNHPEEYGVNDGYLVEAETVTNADGSYTFPDLGPGQYRLREVGQDGWTQTTSNPAEINPLISEQPVTHADFGNYGTPNVTVTKTVNKPTAVPGDTLQYTITVTNTGAGDAFGVRVDDTLPADYIGAPNAIVPAPTSQAGGHLVWENVTVPAGGTFVATFTVTVDAIMPAGSTVITNTVDLGNSASQDEDLFSLLAITPATVIGPIYSGHATAVTTVNAAPTISLDKQGPATGTPGQQLTYTLQWSVNGNATATSAIITDTIPTNTTFVSADNSGSFLNGVVTWNLGTKAPSTTGNVSVTVLVNPSLTVATTLTNTGVFDTDQTQPTTDTVQTEIRVPQVLGVSAEADLTLTKSVNKDTATPGSKLTYTIVVTNTGEADATNVVVTDNLPDGFVFLAGGKSTRTWNLGTLAAGTSKTLTYKVLVGNDVIAGQHVNRAFVTADFFDPIVAQAIVTVKIPQVLGLADTGAGLQDLLTFVLGFVLLAAGSYGFRKLRRGQAQA